MQGSVPSGVADEASRGPRIRLQAEEDSFVRTKVSFVATKVSRVVAKVTLGRAYGPFVAENVTS